jgi:hypothetical protein
MKLGAIGKEERSAVVLESHKRRDRKSAGKPKCLKGIYAGLNIGLGMRSIGMIVLTNASTARSERQL